MATENTIENFVSTVTGKAGLARNNRFLVEIPNSRLSSLYCEGTSLPGAVIATRAQRIFGPMHIRGNNIDYGGTLTFTFYVDREMSVKKFFDGWIHSVINPGTFSVNYFDEYKSDIKIHQIDEKEEIMYTSTLVDAFPVALAPMELNQGNQGAFHRLAVTFAFRFWNTDSITNNQTVIPSISTPAQRQLQLDSAAAAAKRFDIASPVETTGTPPPAVRFETTPGGAATQIRSMRRFLGK